MFRCRYNIVFLILLLNQNHSIADVLVPPFVPGNVSISTELLLSLEKRIANHFSSLVWGGGGIIANLPLESWQSNICPGFEGALELRSYPCAIEMKKTFLSLYGGFGYMHFRESSSNNWVSISTLGIKLGHKFIPLSFDSRSLRIDIEPYLSIAWTSYWQRYWTNLGVRFIGEIRI